MKKSVSEETYDSKERKPLRKNDIETVESNGTKAIVEETFSDDISSSNIVTAHDIQVKSSSKKIPFIDDPNMKTHKEHESDIVGDVHPPSKSHFAQRIKPTSSEDEILKKKEIDAKPEIVKDIHPPLSSHSRERNQPSLSEDKILKKKEIDAKPEIVKDIHPPLSGHSAQSNQPASSVDKRLKKNEVNAKPEIVTHHKYLRHPNNINNLGETINQEPSPDQVPSPISTSDYDHFNNETEDIEENIQRETAQISPMNDFINNETIEAYVVTDESSRPKEAPIHATAVQIEKEKKRILCCPETVFKTKNGNVKKRYWAFLAILIIISAITGIVISVTSKSSTDSPNIENTTPGKTSTSSQSPSLIPTSQPSINPTATSCNFLCLTEIEQSECPNDTSLLKSCHIAEVDNLCITETPCAANEVTSKCGILFHVYRKIRCPIDMPWRQVSNGFEYYVETLKMDWLSHRQRANQYNASLASIHSQAELSLTIKMINDIENKDSYYIGGSRRGIVGDPWTNGTEIYWEWTDNTPWDFTAWNSGEPDGISMGNNLHESVVVIRDSRMLDAFSTLNFPAVYKRQRIENYPQSLELPHKLGKIHSCALQNNTNVYCWGGNSDGQLGDGTDTTRLIPTTINAGNVTVVNQLALGYFHSCVLLDDGRIVKCWGSNSNFQLGDGSSTDRPIPTVINVGNGKIVSQLALGGYYHSFALMNDGSVECWGDNRFGQLGDGSTTRRPIPTVVNIGNGTRVTQLALGHTHSCALLIDATVKCWGRNDNGELGDGTTTTRLIPTVINVGNGKPVVQLALGGLHSCALLDDGTIKCWGSNSDGQLGVGTNRNKLIPTAVDVGKGARVTKLALGSTHTCALLDDGTIKCWGLNSDGQLGDGTKTNRLTPTVIDIGNETNVTQLVLGDAHSCVLLDSGTVKCWGTNDDGRFGDGSTIGNSDASLAGATLFFVN